MISENPKYHGRGMMVSSGILLALQLHQICFEDIFFLEKKKNVIINGTFTKLTYSDADVMFNALYVYVPLHMNHHTSYSSIGNSSSHMSFTPYSLKNEKIVKYLIGLEHRILEQYMLQMPDNNTTTKAFNYSLSSQLEKGSIKVYSSHAAADGEAFNNIKFTGISREGVDVSATRMISEERNPIHKFVLKMSGVWESDTHIGLTFKFIKIK
jgi:hypothetical protein